jgi:plastocyanin
MAGCGSIDAGLKALEPYLIVTPDFADADEVALGSTTDMVVEAMAVDGEVKILSVEVINIIGDGFAYEGEAGTISVGETEPIQLPFSFVPAELGPHAAQITLFTDEGETHEHLVELRGFSAQGLLTVSPGLLDFGPVAAGESESLTVTISNIGDFPVTNLALSSSDGAYVAEPSTLTIDAGDSEDVTITFTAASTDSSHAELEGEDVDGVGVGPVIMRANACGEGDPTLYDADESPAVRWTATTAARMCTPAPPRSATASIRTATAPSTRPPTATMMTATASPRQMVTATMAISGSTPATSRTWSTASTTTATAWWTRAPAMWTATATA